MKKGGAFFAFPGKERAMRQETKAVEKTGAGATGPPKKYTVPSLRDLSRCEGCPYPRVGFICWSPDGTCMKTDMDGFSRAQKGR